MFLAGCEYKCSVEAVSTSTHINETHTSPSLVEANTSSCDHDEKRIDLYLYYVLVILLPILGFIGKGTNRWIEFVYLIYRLIFGLH